MSFFAELKRRNVFRVAIAYSITAWLIAQIAGLAATSFFAPDWVMKMIITVLVLGFPVAMVMAWAYEMTPEGLRRESGDQTQSSSNTSKLDRTIIIALVAALAYFAYDKFVLDPGRDAVMLETAGLQSQQVDAPGLQATRSIAVLPFVNMSTDEDNEYFADGLSEELLNILVKIPELRVAARTSSFSFKGKDATVADIAQELNVSYVLEGSVRKSGKQVRITAQLIQTDDGFHLWSENYDRMLDDIFVVQDEIARQVSQALKVTLLGSSQAERAVDPESYSLYLRGLHFLRQRGPDNMPVARGFLEEAVEIDPENAMAWNVLASVYNEMINFGLMPREEGLPLVRNALDNAQRLAPERAIIWANDGFIKKNLHWDWKGAQANLDKAFQMEPNNETQLGWRASLAGSLGRLEESILMYEKDFARDPLNLSMHSALGLAYTKVGRYDDAIRIFEKQLQLAPNYHWAHSNMGKALLFQGDATRALDTISKNPENIFKATSLAVVYHSLGAQNESDAKLQSLLSEYGDGRYFYFIACVFSWRGEKDQAFDWLEKAYQARETGIAYMLGENLLYPILDDPRWTEFLKKVGLYEYWLAMPAKYGGPQL